MPKSPPSRGIRWHRHWKRPSRRRLQDRRRRVWQLSRFPKCRSQCREKIPASSPSGPWYRNRPSRFRTRLRLLQNLGLRARLLPCRALAIRLRVPDRPGWASEWDRNGDVQVRIRAVSLAALPIINVDKERSYTADKHLVFWLEIQNVSDRPHTYRRWQPVTSGECTLYSPSGAAMPIVIFPNQHRFDWTEDYERKLEPGADPLIETVFFSTPQDVASQHVLQLKAGHVGEKYLFTFKVPGNVPGK